MEATYYATTEDSLNDTTAATVDFRQPPPAEAFRRQAANSHAEKARGQPPITEATPAIRY